MPKLKLSIRLSLNQTLQSIISDKKKIMNVNLYFKSEKNLFLRYCWDEKDRATPFLYVLFKIKCFYIKDHEMMSIYQNYKWGKSIKE